MGTGTEIASGTAIRAGMRELIDPHRAAVIGANPRIAEVVRGATRGEASVWGVHPDHRVVGEMRCFPDLREVPEAPELAMLMVSHAGLERAFDQAVAAGIRAMVIPGLGSEAGDQRAAIADRIRRRAIELDIALCGPNCMGIASPGAASFWIGTVPETTPPGGIAVVAQSGSVGEAMMTLGDRVGIRTVVSSGSEASRDAADYLSYFVADERTTAIGLFLETVRRPEAFASALAAAAAVDKPVVCLKVGRSEQGARAAGAHTGAIVGSARGFSALLARWGAIEVDSFQQMVETLEVIGRTRRPSGGRVGMVTESGGESSLFLDHAADTSLSFPMLPDAVRTRLRADFPNLARPANPLDPWAVEDPTRIYDRCIELLADSGAFDILVAQVDLTQFRGDDEQVWCESIVRSLGEHGRRRGLAAVVSTLGSSDPPQRFAALAREHGVALVRGPEHAVRALDALLRPRSTSVAAAAEDREPISIEDLVGDGGSLSEFDSSAIVARYGVPVVRSERAASPEGAAEVAARLGFPVVVKVDGPPHKAAVGGVVTGVVDRPGAREAAARIGGPVLVARQVPAAPEVFAGFTRDPDYGPLIAVGWGGSMVESTTPAVALGPLDRRTAEELIAAAGLPEQARSVAGVLVALGRLAAEHPEVAEVDLNPLLLSPEGPVAVDALVVMQPESSFQSSQPGGRDQMYRALLVADEDDPRARPTEISDSDLPDMDVTVEVAYSSLNYKDALALTGRAPVVRRFPLVPGIDLAGTVVESRDPSFSPGDQVLATGFGLGESHWGGYAERARVDPAWLTPIPDGLSARQAMAIGTAGFTAMLCVMRLEEHGIGFGDVLVTGAGGGVGGLAIAILSSLGHRVVASTGRPAESSYLYELGADAVIDRAELSEAGKPLRKERWSAAVDAVGGTTLANVCATLRYGGMVAACGNAGGMDLPASVAPFILRGVTLAGVDSVRVPIERRVEVWRRLASLDSSLVESVAEEIGLGDLLGKAEEVLAGQVRGRLVVDIGR